MVWAWLPSDSTNSSFCSLQGPFCPLRLLLESPPCFLQSVIIHYTSNKVFWLPYYFPVKQDRGLIPGTVETLSSFVFQYCFSLYSIAIKFGEIASFCLVSGLNFWAYTLIYFLFYLSIAKSFHCTLFYNSENPLTLFITPFPGPVT